MPKHPHVGKPRLAWAVNEHGVKTAYIERDAKYKSAKMYVTREMLAMIRPTFTSAGLLGDLDGEFVVLRGAFDEVRCFENEASAMVYIEALFALEAGE